MALDLDLNQPWFLDEEELEENQNHDISSGDEVDDNELGDMFFDDGANINLIKEQHTTNPFDLNMESPETEQKMTELNFNNIIHRQQHTILQKQGCNYNIFNKKLIRK